MSLCQDRPGLHSYEGWTGAGGPTSKVAHSLGCWQEASVPHDVGHSTGLLEYYRDMAAGPPRASGLREQEGSHSAY